MECKKISKMLNAYIDEELDPYSMYVVKSHLKNCKTCKNEMEEYLFIRRCHRFTKSIEPSEEFSANLCSLFKEENQAINLNEKKQFCFCTSQHKIILGFICVAICVIMILSSEDFNLETHKNMSNGHLDTLSEQMTRDILRNDLNNTYSNKNTNHLEFMPVNNISNN